jgi:hypothetical protein
MLTCLLCFVCRALKINCEGQCMAGSCSTHLQVNSPMFVNIIRGAPKGIPPVGFPQVWLFPCTSLLDTNNLSPSLSLQVSPALNTIPYSPLFTAPRRVATSSSSSFSSSSSSLRYLHTTTYFKSRISTCLAREYVLPMGTFLGVDKTISAYPEDAAH